MTITTLVIHVKHHMMMSVAITAMIVDGHGLSMTQLSGAPRTLTVDANHNLYNLSYDVKIKQNKPLFIIYN